MKKVAIIGGGPGGLFTAHALNKRCGTLAQVTLFEASGRLGGKVLSSHFETESIPYEAGAAELYDYSQLGPDPLRELVAELGLSTHTMTGATVILGDHILTTEEDVQKAFGADCWNALRKFKRRARNGISPAEYYESDWKLDNEDPLSRQSFRALLDTVEHPIARRYLEVACHSDLATEPENTNAMYGLQNILMDESDYMRLYTIQGGIEMLTATLAKRINARVLLHHAVKRVERKGDGFTLTSRNQGEWRKEDFDYVVTALPNNWILGIDWGEPKLADAMRRHHAYYDFPAHYLRVSALFDRPFWRGMLSGSYFMSDAFGGCCLYDESSRTSVGPYGVLGWLIAGEAALTLSNFQDAVLFDQVLDSFPSALQFGRTHFLEGKVHRWVGSVNGLPGGKPMREPDSRHVPEPTDYADLFVVGDYLFDSTLNGVLDSADVVAEWIEDELKESPAPVSADIAIPEVHPVSVFEKSSSNG